MSQAANPLFFSISPLYCRFSPDLQHEIDCCLAGMHAAAVLGSMGDEAEPAVPALIEMLKSDDVHDRRLAARTLGEIGPAAEMRSRRCSLRSMTMTTPLQRWRNRPWN